MPEAAAPPGGTSTSAPPTPGILRRVAGMAYELLLLLGVLFVSTYAFLIFGLALEHSWRRPLLQVWALTVCGIYFVWLWRHGGQTLPMKTWHMRLTSASGGPLSLRQAVARYLLACVLIPAAGIGIVWALLDPDRQFLYDRLAGTRIVTTEPR